ncbi:unnamed protein product, partial [Amoebophrya sp. A25]
VFSSSVELDSRAREPSSSLSTKFLRSLGIENERSSGGGAESVKYEHRC